MAYAPVAVIALLMGLVPLLRGDSPRTFMGLATTVVVFACYATAFNIIFGSTGQLFLCLGALAGVAGYGTAIFTDRLGWPAVVAVVVATAASALLGALFSWVSVRRSLDVIFTGIVTLAFSLGFGNLLLGQRDLTGGETGIVIDTGEGTLLRDLVPAYYVFLALLVVFLVGFRWLQRSHFGWAFRALKDDEMTAELAGVNVARYRIWAGGIGSAMLGLTGALYTLHEGFISPSTFAFAHVDVRTLVMLAFGGIGTLVGPVIGAVSFGLIDEALRGLGQLRVAVYGAILVALFLGFRQGVGPAVVKVLKRMGGRRTQTRASQPPPKR
ncbi:MAG TPA: branched-chain amino acid ABC transporter permease [Euzebya sp.]|nr:branched-chain amino acid ABC transporter permease [Euzebya sp.]